MACGLGPGGRTFFVPFVVNAINSRHKTALGLAALVLVVSIALIFAPGIAFMVLVFCLAAFSGAPGAIYPAWTAENFGLAQRSQLRLCHVASACRPWCRSAWSTR